MITDSLNGSTLSLSRWSETNGDGGNEKSFDYLCPEHALSSAVERGNQCAGSLYWGFTGRRLASKQIAVSHSAESCLMSVDTDTVKRVAKLSRIAITDARAESMQAELNTILGFVEQLNEVNVEGVEPMTSVVDMEMRKRTDKVTDGNKADDVTANAPVSEDHFFMVPKVVE